MATKAELEQRIEGAITKIETYGGIDGAHHKQWVIDQVVRALKGPDYDEWLRVMNDDPRYPEWDHGIAP